ncbi:MAG: dihydrodipicolinate reductase, partial [Nitrososphaerota archaeon]|nr:dihydrodipicolinate reductase [Nitrososphaerota archaeon]
MSKIKAASFGVGIIGSAAAKFILEEKKQRLELVGAFDIDPAKVGRDVGEVVGLGRSAGVKVTNDLGDALRNADVAIHTTSSYLKTAYPQLESILSHGVDVVSSCEELSYPYVVDKELSSRIDMQAKKNGATVLGTGINPGFLMDALPIALTSPCKSIRRITVSRRMNAAT